MSFLPTPHPELSLPRAFISWMRESVAYRGAWGTLKHLGEEIWRFAKDSTPEQRRIRFGDIEYDCDFAVDTTWARLPVSVRLREIFSERQYQPTAPEEFREIMQRIDADLSEFTFIDLGSGKGRALLLAAEYPFRRIIGVELQDELHRIAEQNIAKFDSPARVCNEIISCAGDARDYQFPNEPIFLYLFNPFPEYVLRQVTENLQRSLDEHPRPVFVVYNTPECGFILNDAPALKRAITTIGYSIYVSVDGH